MENRILKTLDSAFIAWCVYAGARIADVLSTAYRLEMGGRNPALEIHLIPRLFMRYYGVHRGNILHEVAVLGAAILAYMMLSHARRRTRLLALATPRLVPYTIAAVSAFGAACNLTQCMR